MADKAHLIVTGVARSGTTALAELLNAHESIALGIERFKFQYLLHGNYDRTLFDRSRFFDFRAEDTNLRPEVKPHWQTVYDEIARKWDDVTVLGDKVPDLTPILADFMAANPDYKYIFILRNLRDVGLSWQTRANRVRDSWPASKGFLAACESWVLQMQILHAMVHNKPFRKLMDQRLLLLDYDAMYEEGNGSAQAILTFLGLPPSAGYTATFEKHVEFSRNKADRRIPKQFLPAHKAIDMSLARDLRRRSRAQILRLTGTDEVGRDQVETGSELVTAVPKA